MSRYRRKTTEDAGVVNAALLRVARAFSKQLAEKGISHALIGGLAVCAHGYRRHTDDVDFLLAEESRDEVAGDALGGEVEGKTVRYRGVDVDLLFPKAGEGFLESGIRAATGGIPTIGIADLIYLKLAAARMRDQGDVVELVKRGRVPVAKVAAFLKDHRPDLVEEFEALVLQARHEAD